MTIRERYLQPDWSKAPADAEFYAPMSEDEDFFPVWIRGDLDDAYDIVFALEGEDSGPFVDFTTETPRWAAYSATGNNTRTNYYKSALIPRPSELPSENEWVNT